MVKYSHKPDSLFEYKNNTKYTHKQKELLLFSLKILIGAYSAVITSSKLTAIYKSYKAEKIKNAA